VLRANDRGADAPFRLGRRCEKNKCLEDADTLLLRLASVDIGTARREFKGIEICCDDGEQPDFCVMEALRIHLTFMSDLRRLTTPPRVTPPHPRQYVVSDPYAPIRLQYIQLVRTSGPAFVRNDLPTPPILFRERRRAPHFGEYGMKFAGRFLAVAAIVQVLMLGSAFAGDRGTKPEAVAMVKKAVAFVQSNGSQKAYAEFSNKGGSFTDRDLYVVVYDLTGRCLAHGSNAKLVGKDLSDAQDADGVYYVRDRIQQAKANASFWQNYKFSDPVTKKIEPKSTYCERLNDTAICVGVYN